MLFKDYLNAMNELAKNSPETLEMPCVYARDDEGNGYQGVGYTPSVGTFIPDGRYFDCICQSDIDAGEYDEYTLASEFTKGVLIN